MAGIVPEPVSIEDGAAPRRRRRRRRRPAPTPRPKNFTIAAAWGFLIGAAAILGAVSFMDIAFRDAASRNR